MILRMHMLKTKLIWRSSNKRMITNSGLMERMLMNSNSKISHNIGVVMITMVTKDIDLGHLQVESLLL